jgi:predicted DNA-binding transcriptional regulator YafY
MKTNELKRIYTIHRFFAAKRKIYPSAMAKKLGISRATLFRDLEKIKDIGAPITYCRLTKVHYYKEDFHISEIEFYRKFI